MSPAPPSVTAQEPLPPAAAMPEESARIARLQEEISVKKEMSKISKEELEKIELYKPFTSDLVWKNIIGFVFLHLMALASAPRCFWWCTTDYKTVLFAAFVGVASAQGVLVGAHRLYSHKAFKATWQLRFLLLLLHTVAGQNCMYVWVRDHRLHHKYSDTNADPHNARRGFWFSHVGWLCMRKHPLVIEKGKTIDLSDLEADSLLMFQKKYYKPLYFIFAAIIPVYIPMWLWNEAFIESFLSVYFGRYLIVLNLTWTVNSVAHLYGTKPYDMNIMPRESPAVGFWGLGEGWHNYHHTFPWDYRAAELGIHNSFTTRVIDLCAKIGWAYNLKSASDDLVRRRIFRTGDGSRQIHDHHIEEAEPDPDDYVTEAIITPEEPKLTARHRG